MTEVTTRVLGLFLATLPVGVILPEGDEPSRGTGEVKEQFDELLRKARARPRSRSSSIQIDFSKNPPLRGMVALGPRCLPFLLDVVEDEPPDEHELLCVVVGIMKTPLDLIAARKTGSFRQWTRSKLRNGYKDAGRRFPDLMRKWQEEQTGAKGQVLWQDVTSLDPEFKVLRTKRERSQLGRIYGQVRELGIFVLPVLMDEFRKGQYEFVSIVPELTDGNARLRGGRAEDMARAHLAWWEEHRTEWLIEMPIDPGAPPGQ